MKGRQVAERGQQKPGQFPAQAKEAQWPQAGVWTGAGTQRGRQREGRADGVREEEQKHRDVVEIHVEPERHRDCDVDRYTRDREEDRKGQTERQGGDRERQTGMETETGVRDIHGGDRTQVRDIHRLGIRTKACSEIGMGQRLMETGSVGRG